MTYEKQPTKEDVINRLKNVVNGHMTREDFNIWVSLWVENFDSRNRLSIDEDKMHKYFIDLLAIDLEIEKGVYFHEVEEIKEWIEKIKSGKLLS